MHVEMRRGRNAVRISVEDDGAEAMEALQPRPRLPDPEDPGDLVLADEATTGRGLAIVSILASDWGVDQTERASACRPTSTTAPRATACASRRPMPTPRGGPAQRRAPAGWVLVRLVGCPVQL